MVQRFNYQYKNNFENGWKFTVYGRIFWGWAHDQPGGGHRVDIKSRGFGPDYKCLSIFGFQVTTIFYNVIIKEVNDKRKYTKEYGDGAGASSVLSLFKASGIESSNHSVIADIWFGGIRCVIGLSKLVLQAITNIKTVTAGYCKQ